MCEIVGVKLIMVKLPTTAMQEMQQQTYFRPEWTCGRYNSMSETAIMYNLIAGESFFFESHSAVVIGEILEVPRNGQININIISEHTGIATESIVQFAEMLVDNGLLCNQIFSKEEIRKLRIKQGLNIKESSPQMQLLNNGPIDMSSAEEDYQNTLNINNRIPTAMLELTYNCSERCIHCYNAGATRNDCEVSGRNRNEMSLEDYRTLIDELYELGTYKVVLTGGDPFSKPIVWEIIDYLYQKNIAFDIFTNGQSITDKIERLVDYYPRLIGLSVYSGISEVHDKITRVKGSFEKTISVATQLSDYGIPIVFKCVVFKINANSYHTVKPLAKQLGAILQIEINLSNGIDGDTSIVNHLRLPTEILEIILQDPQVPMYVDAEHPRNGGGPKPMDAYPCRAGIESFNITPDGMVVPCCAFHMPFGNVRHQSLKDILNEEGVRTWRNVRIRDMEECGRHPECDYCYLCAGNNYLEHGTPLKASQVSCFMAKVRYGLVQKLLSGNNPLNGKSVEECLNELTIDDVQTFGKEISKH